MPTYDYECQSCGHRFEKFQSMTAKVLRKCPECSERSLQRLIGPGGGFIFKGDGFYITDYRSQSYKAGEKAASGKDDGTGKATVDKPSVDSKGDSKGGSKGGTKGGTPSDSKSSSPKD